MLQSYCGVFLHHVNIELSVTFVVPRCTVCDIVYDTRNAINTVFSKVCFPVGSQLTEIIHGSSYVQVLSIDLTYKLQHLLVITLTIIIGKVGTLLLFRLLWTTITYSVTYIGWPRKSWLKVNV